MLELPTNEEVVLNLDTAEGKARQKAVDMNLTAVGAYKWEITTNIVAIMVFDLWQNQIILPCCWKLMPYAPCYS
jgi:hypothetical protein